MKLGIFGDSFGYQNSTNLFPSWVDHLSQHGIIDNYCQCGVGEYKILQQLKAVNLNYYDQIIITHTSPGRVFIRNNPLYSDSTTHKHCDILFSDIEHRDDQFSKTCHNYFKYIFDMDYAIDIHNMICHEIDSLTKQYNVIHLTHFDYSKCYQYPSILNFHKMWLKNRGPVNHYNEYGNQEIYRVLLKKIENLGINQV